MKFKIIPAVFVLLVSVLPAAAQALLPSSFGGWTATGEAALFPATEVGQASGVEAPILREYGIRSAERREFAQGSQAATVNLFRMIDPTAAFGAFTFFRSTEMTPLDLADAAPYSAGTRNRALFVVGNFVFDVSAPEIRPDDMDLEVLALAVTRQADKRPFPRLAEFLPEQGLVPGSEKFVLGPRAMGRLFSVKNDAPADWVGFDKSAEAMIARYRLPRAREATLLLVIYPTQQIAAEQYGAFGKWMELNPDGGQSTGDLAAFGTRSTALIALASGDVSREEAAQLFSRIRYGSEVTWNEAGQRFSDPSISNIVVGAFVYSGLLMVFALAAGVGFGGFRLFVKFLFPGKVFDRAASVEILQLGLASKPIDIKDFYQ